jgi:hypothetical protein
MPTAVAPIALQVVPSSAPTPVKNVDSPADPRKSDILTGRAPPRGRKPTTIGQAVQHAVSGGSSGSSGSSSSGSAASPAAQSASASPSSASTQPRRQAAGGAAAPGRRQASEAGTLRHCVRQPAQAARQKPSIVCESSLTCFPFQALARPQHGHQPRQASRQRQCAQPRPLPSLRRLVQLPVVPLASPQPPVPLRLVHLQPVQPSSRQPSSRSLLPAAKRQPPALLPHQSRIARAPTAAQLRVLLPQPTGARARHQVLDPGLREAILRFVRQSCKAVPRQHMATRAHAEILTCHRVGCAVNVK